MKGSIMAQAKQAELPAIEQETEAQETLTERIEQCRDWIAQAALLEAALDDEKKAFEGTSKELDSAKAGAVNTVTCALIDGILTPAQASNLYGEAFGFKTKKDGTKSETPNGTGETLRKRSTLLSQAYAIGQGNVPESLWPASLAGKSVQEIADTMADWSKGTLSPWQAYKNLTQKPKAKLALWEDEKKLLELVKALQDDVTLATIREDAALTKVYNALAAAWLAE